MKVNRKDFPWFKNNTEWTYLDSGATSLKPKVVIEAVVDYLSKESYNTHNTDSIKTYENKKIYIETKKLIAQYINASDKNIAFTPGATASLNIIGLGLDDYFSSQDEIVLSTLEHASNILPFIELSKRTGAKIKYIESDNLMLTEEDILKSINSKTKLISFTNSSNLIGKKINAEEISLKIKKINPNTLISVDATQYLATKRMQINKSKIDFLMCSAHKMFAPTGIGMLYISEAGLKILKPKIVGGGMNSEISKFDYKPYKNIEKFEFGTLNIEGIYGWKAAFEYYNKIDQEYELERICNLKNYLEEKLSKNDKLIFLNKNLKSNIFIFGVKKIHGQDFAHYLDSKKIIVRSGLACAKLIHENIKTMDVIRISLHFYNNKTDIDKLIKAINEYNYGDELIGLV